MCISTTVIEEECMPRTYVHHYCSSKRVINIDILNKPGPVSCGLILTNEHVWEEPINLVVKWLLTQIYFNDSLASTEACAYTMFLVLWLLSTYIIMYVTSMTRRKNMDIVIITTESCNIVKYLAHGLLLMV